MSALRQPTPPTDTHAVAAVPATSREVLDSIREAYSFVDASNEAETLGMLAKRPDVAAVLLDALPHVGEVFGAETQVLLISTDHHDGQPPSLSARIRARGSIAKQLANQDKFYRTWWLHAGDNVLGN